MKNKYIKTFESFDEQKLETNDNLKYYDIYASVFDKGYVLYYYNEDTGEFDIFKGKHDTIELAKEIAEADGYERRPMYWRY